MKNKTAIAGIGHTAFSKNIGRPEREIALEVVKKARVLRMNPWVD
jgi:hypothetical protein